MNQIANNVEAYGWKSETPPPSCGYLAPAILHILKALPVKNILDIGAGNGKLCEEINKHGYYVAGTDYDQEGVEICRTFYPHIHFYQYAVEDTPTELLEKEPVFDAVVSTEVIEHLYSPHNLPIFASKVLKKDGYLILTTPYHGYIKNLALSVFNKWDKHHTVLWHGGHIKFWSRKSLTTLLEKTGFQVVDFQGVGRVSYLWKSMVLIAQKK
jgi:2-polyprenyl-3-methyl-5-hydroxy-6-metoxy-1,4-benzoquinol methylase